MAETRPRTITRKDTDSLPQIIHDIDQFGWYNDIKARTSGLEEDSKESLSTVRFMLPYIVGKEVPSYIVVVGNGSDICEAYIARVNEGTHVLAIETPQKSGLWKIFSYIENREFYDTGETKHVIEELPMKIGEIFLTEISPFLRRGNYPLDCDRVYEFPLYDGDKFKVIARNRKNENAENLEMVWSPNPRHDPERTLITIQGHSWIDPEKMRSMPFTDQFTFPISINTKGL